MFHSSTQKASWIFDSERHLTRFRAEANATYCQKVSEMATEWYMHVCMSSFGVLLFGSILMKQSVSDVIAAHTGL